jgi:alpha,alpha-trehalase
MRFPVAAFAAALGAVGVQALYENGSVIAPCDSPIYCYGDLLREIELARPFEDSKTFVDLCVSLPLGVAIILTNWELQTYDETAQ